MAPLAHRSVFLAGLLSAGAAALVVFAACSNGDSFYDETIPDTGVPEGDIFDEAGNELGDRFCLHTDAGLCADFDGPNVGAWGDPNNQTQPVAATVPKGSDLEIGDGPSGKDLVSTLPAGGETTSITRDFSAPIGTALRVDCDLAIPKPGATWTDNPVDVLGIVYGDFAVYAELAGRDATDGTVALAANGTTVTTGSGLVVPYDTWFHLTLTADPVAGTAHLTTSLGADLAASGLADAGAASQVTVRVGLGRMAPSVTPTALVLQADNVTAATP